MTFGVSEGQMSSKLYVGNLAYNTTKESLEQAFAQFGTVTEAIVVTDRDTGSSRGFGFVTMSSAEEAAAAREGMDGADLEGRRLKVDEAKERTDRGGGGGGYRGGGGGGYGGGRGDYRR
jgi:RNA recognition motif-containing protein